MKACSPMKGKKAGRGKKRGGGSGSGATFPFKPGGGRGSKKGPSQEAIDGMRDSGLRIK